MNSPLRWAMALRVFLSFFLIPFPELLSHASCGVRVISTENGMAMSAQALAPFQEWARQTYVGRRSADLVKTFQLFRAVVWGWTYRGLNRLQRNYPHWKSVAFIRDAVESHLGKRVDSLVRRSTYLFRQMTNPAYRAMVQRRANIRLIFRERARGRLTAEAAEEFQKIIRGGNAPVLLYMDLISIQFLMEAFLRFLVPSSSVMMIVGLSTGQLWMVVWSLASPFIRFLSCFTFVYLHGRQLPGQLLLYTCSLIPGLGLLAPNIAFLRVNYRFAAFLIRTRFESWGRKLPWIGEEDGFGEKLLGWAAQVFFIDAVFVLPFSMITAVFGGAVLEGLGYPAGWAIGLAIGAYLGVAGFWAVVRWITDDTLVTARQIYRSVFHKVTLLARLPDPGNLGDEAFYSFGSGLSLPKAWMFPFQNSVSKRDVVRGAVLFAVPVVGYLWNVGYRAVMGHRVLRGESPWAPSVAFWTVAGYGVQIVACIGFYALLPTAAAFLWAGPKAAIVTFFIGFHLMPSIGVGFCERFSVFDLYPRWSLLRLPSYWKAWAIVWPAFLLSLLSVLAFVVPFFFFTTWFYHVLAYCFGSVYLESRGFPLSSLTGSAAFTQLGETGGAFRAGVRNPLPSQQVSVLAAA